ncbi:MAG: DUF5686 family protein [Flavobacteriia bacterium]|jgi:hypothetical protein|nr:DUF5686 family protein [Cryomorphaceae bacterium]
MKICAALLFLFLGLNTSAQSYFIHDSFTGEAIPFVKVLPSTGEPFLADLDGAIRFTSLPETVELRAGGYRDTIISLATLKDSILQMQPYVQFIQEMRAVAGENPAHRIINLAIANRKKNNPLENDAFRYESYSKFIFDVNRDGIDGFLKDTSKATPGNFLDQQYILILESASTRTFIPPAHDKEEITAYRVSGFSDPALSTFANELQSFSFYENQFNLLGKTYINPIAFGGTNRYVFVLEDTTIVNRDTTFTIFYRPRTGKNFDGMTGRLYINTNGYAIEKVTAKPYLDTAGTPVTIVQEYVFVEGKKWFPSKLSTEIELRSLPITLRAKDSTIVMTFLEGRGSTYVKKVEINPEGLRKRDFSNVTVMTNEDANAVKDETWDSLRVYKITEKEKRTYTVIDSVSKAEHLEERLTTVSSLADGKIPMKALALDLTRLLDFNYYERYRLGFGLETSKKTMKNAVIGGYYGWSTGDRTNKFGGYSTVHLSRKHGVKIDARYQQDLLERGGTNFIKDAFNLNSTSVYRDLFITNMERQRLGEVAFSANVLPNLKMTLLGNYQRIWFTGDYQFYPNGIATAFPLRDIDLAETGIEFNWNIGEKVMMLGNKRISKGTKYPKIRVRAVKGWKGIFESDFDYYRFNAEIQQNISIRGIGTFMWTIQAGQTIGDMPLFLMHNGNGTGKNWMISAPNTFETMMPSEFYQQRQAALYTRLTFYSIKTGKKWTQPQFALHHAVGYGDMPNTNHHSTSFKTMDKGFFEGGLIINSLITSNVSGIGIGVFYRYGAYANSDWKMNLVPKITATIKM